MQRVLASSTNHADDNILPTKADDWDLETEEEVDESLWLRLWLLKRDQKVYLREQEKDRSKNVVRRMSKRAVEGVYIYADTGDQHHL